MKKLEKLSSKKLTKKSMYKTIGGIMPPGITFHDTHCTDSGNGSSDCEDSYQDKDK